MIRYYDCFGVTIRSEFSFPWPTEPAGETDIVVAHGDVRAPTGDEDTPVFISRDETIVLAVPGVARFAVEGGESIVVDAADGATDRTLQAYLTGSVLGVALHQRDALLIHASVVAQNGRAVAIAGPRGRGKSTLAGTLVREGWRLVTDDKAVIDPSDGEVRRGPPVLKLAPDTARRLDAPLDPRGPVGVSGKRYYDVPARPAAAPSLDRIYLLAPAAGPPTVERLAPAERVGSLLETVYRVELLSELETIPGRFEDCATIARRTPVYRLSYPRRFDALGQTCDRILRTVVE